MTDGVSAPDRICQLCVEILKVTGAGISMVTTAGNRGVLCSTDPVSAEIEELQLRLGEGPCVDAVRSGGPVLIPDLYRPDDLAVERWPAFMAGAAAAGVRAVFAFPLRIGAITVGALDLYRSTPGDLTSEQLRAALIASDAAALAVMRAEFQPFPPLEDLEQPTMYQAQVHQATGMVQVQLSVTTEEAFLLLRARAFATGRPLSDIAQDVVDRRLRFSPEDS